MKLHQPAQQLVRGVVAGQGRAVSIPGPARVIGAALCPECDSAPRCRRDRLCWAAERAAIAAERELL